MDRGMRRRMPPPSQLASRKAERIVRSTESTTDTKSDQTKAPIILAKPHRPLEENDEDWPTIGAASSVRSRTQSPALATQSETLADTLAGPSKSSGSVPGMVQIRGGQRPGVSITPELARKRPSIPVETTTSRVLKGGLKLVTENMDWSDQILEHLSSENTDFIVVGVLGPQGTGKSTLLSMLGGNDPFDMYRQYIFRPASREAVETCRHQTAGVQIYPTKSRVILIDCQPLMNAAVLDEMLRLDKRYNFEYRTVENFTEIESLQLASFVLQICHVVLICVDWFLDLNLARFLQTAEMLKPNAAHLLQSETTQFIDRYPNIAFVHQRAKTEDFRVCTYQERCKALAQLFRSSSLNLKSDISMAHSRYCHFQGENSAEIEDIGYFLLPDMKLRGQKPTNESAQSSSSATFKSVGDYEKLIEDLRLLVRAQPKPPFTVAGTPKLTEKAWYNYAAKVWEAIRKSHLFAEYGRMLP